MGLTAALWTMAGASVVSGYSTIQQGREAQKQARAQRGIQLRQERRERIASLRQQQLAQAQITASAQEGGTLDSSGFGGAFSSIGSTTAGNLSFNQQIASLQEQIARSRSRQYEWGMVGAIANTVGNLASVYTQQPNVE